MTSSKRLSIHSPFAQMSCLRSKHFLPTIRMHRTYPSFSVLCSPVCSHNPRRCTPRLEISQLLKLVEPLQGSFEGAYELSQVGVFLISCARNGNLHVRIDHAEGTLAFIDEAFGASTSTAGPSGGTPGLDKSVQPLAHNLVRTRLSSISTCLHNALLEG